MQNHALRAGSLVVVQAIAENPENFSVSVFLVGDQFQLSKTKWLVGVDSCHLDHVA